MDEKTVRRSFEFITVYDSVCLGTVHIKAVYGCVLRNGQDDGYVYATVKCSLGGERKWRFRGETVSDYGVLMNVYKRCRRHFNAHVDEWLRMDNTVPMPLELK